MLDRLIRAFLVVGGVSVACAWTWPGAFPEADPVAVPVRYHTPNVYRAVVAWYYVAPGVAVFLAGQFLISTSRIWFARMGVRVGLRSRLPRWPLSPSADGPAIVVGEVHHPVKAIESPAPEWLTIPERGLYTGVAIVGAVGSGKTSACMHPFARQLLSWQATNPERRAAALVLEVKGDFCHDIRRMLTELDRGEDYIELSLDGRLTWNPLSATWLDAYSLAYTVASLLNQLFGKGKEPFWQQAYTNLVRWIIELYRVLPGGWVTLRDVYHCAIDKELFARKIQQAQTYAADMSDTWITIAASAGLAMGSHPLHCDENRLFVRDNPPLGSGGPGPAPRGSSQSRGGEVNHRVVAVIALVAADVLDARLVRQHRVDLLGRRDQRLDHRRRVARVGAVHDLQINGGLDQSA